MNKYFIKVLFVAIVVFTINYTNAETLYGKYIQFRNILNEKSTDINRRLLFTEDSTKGLILDHLLTDFGIALYGFHYWHWGTKSFHKGDEGWFDADSATGGSDKTGHFYMTYLLSRVLSSRMQDRGLNLEKANLYGSVSALLAMTLLEVGDSSSPYGFSKEDLICDTLGAFSAYVLRSNPILDDFIDIRMEYSPNINYLKNGDHTTDYSNMKHLLAFNFSGFDSLEDSPLRFVEFQVGFYSKGYRSYDKVEKSRQVYIGIGFSLKSLAKESGINMLENLFEFYQPGHTYIDTNLWHKKDR